MSILYVMLTRHDKIIVNDFVEDVEKSLEVLRAMDVIHVARRCAQLISEVLDVFKKHVSARERHAAQAQSSEMVYRPPHSRSPLKQANI